MKLKRFALILAVLCLLFSLTACSKECRNGCGEPADPDCYAEMCDKCCDWFCGLNGCYANH